MNKMRNSEEAVTAARQHHQPCIDCPMARQAIPGWLGGATPTEYRGLAHSDTVVPCHVISNQQCAGMAIYRKNVAKRCDPPNLVLPGDTKLVFSTPMEFMAHHESRGKS